MPTPVSTAKQCLNSEASHALEEAVSVARRRGHAQTTSLHAVSAFLSLSPSQLREACVRARNTALYPHVQLKALDLCLSVSLDRLPTSQPRVNEPPVSNSLMAAIKRSQANQRRQPESLIAIRNQNHLLGQCQEQLGTSSGVKVELQHLIVSILDDPIVSRVFNDAGFRSFDVKLAILRPFQSFFRCSQSVGGHQGLFLCNLDENSDPGNHPLRFPFSGYRGNWDGNENYRRIGDVLVRKKGRNPLLVGVCANDALSGFMEVLETRMDVLPLDVHGIRMVSLEKDVLKFVNEHWSDEAMSLRFKEVDMMVRHCLGPGLMVSFGNLRYFLGGENGFGMDVLNSIVRKLSKLLEVHEGKVWLIGFAANDQTYMEFLSRFPSIDKDWDLHLLPITSFKPKIGGESCFKSR
uniref:Clp R domain-containing protein n=1 Tax=Opuntia streptacantha TaxID=393608 RepID=A0A7C9DHC7_OPUST